MVVMDRASRLLGERPWGRKARQLCTQAMARWGEGMQHPSALTLRTDGARRSGRRLCESWSAGLRSGQRGRPQKTRRQGVQVRRKNQGAQRPKRGRKRPKSPPPSPAHPATAQPLATAEMPAPHLEAGKTSRRRRWAAARSRTTTSAQNQPRRQERWEVSWIGQHFVRVPLTTRQGPAVA